MSNYSDVIKRFGLNSNLLEPEFDRPIPKLSDVEKEFLLMEKKYGIEPVTNPVIEKEVFEFETEDEEKPESKPNTKPVKPLIKVRTEGEEHNENV